MKPHPEKPKVPTELEKTSCNEKQCFTVAVRKLDRLKRMRPRARAKIRPRMG